jgi:hypothetical protein
MKRLFLTLFAALWTTALFAGSGTVIINGESVSYWQDGPYVHIDGQTFVTSRIGNTVAVTTIDGTRGTSASFVPNLTAEQAARYLNSTAEGRAASAKFDADLKNADAYFKSIEDESKAALVFLAPRATPAHR